MNFVAGIAVGVGGLLAALRFLPSVFDKLLGPEDPNPKDSEGNSIGG